MRRNTFGPRCQALPKTTTYLARDEAGEILGYLLYCEGGHEPGILEAEGAPQAIESLIHHVLAKSDASKATIYLAQTANSLSNLVGDRLHMRVHPMETGPMMVRVNDAPSAFLTAIRPWLALHHLGERIRYSLEIEDIQQVIGFDNDRNQEGRLVLIGERVEHHKVISRRGLTSMVFGLRESAENAMTNGLHQTRFFSFPIPMLDRS